MGVFLCLYYYRQYPVHRLNIGIGGGALDAVKGIAAVVQNAGDNSKSDKLRDAYTTQAGVQAGKLGYDVYKNNGAIAGAREALATAEASGDLGAIAEAQEGLKNTVAALAPTLNISLSSQKSESENQEIVTESVVSSNTAQNGTTRYIATGEKDADGNIIEGTGDVTTFGTQVDSKNIIVDANNDVNLLPGGNSVVTSSSNSSSGFSVGGSFGVGKASVNASINKGNGSSAGNEQSYTGSNFNASDNLTIKSGGDTNIIGSVVSGNSVTTDINGNLNIESLQDTKTFNSEQNDMSLGASFDFATNAAST